MLAAVYILWLRQIKRYVRSKARMLSSLGQPLLFLLAMGFGFGPIFEKAGGGNYVQFLAPGIITMSILFISIFMGIEVIWDRQFGFLKETLVAPVSRSAIFAGRTLGGATVSLVQGIIVFLITLLVGFRPVNLSLFPLALVFMFLIAVIVTAFGTALASFMQDMHAFPMITNFIVMPLFFLSGALFPLNELPPAISTAAKFNPLSYGVDGLRATLSTGAYFSIGMSLLVLTLCAAALFAIGTWAFSKIQV